MRRQGSSKSNETTDISRALRRAAKGALKLGLKTGTPVYVIQENKIVDLTKKPGATRKSRSTRKS